MTFFPEIGVVAGMFPLFVNRWTFLIAVSGGITCLGGEDWPQWRGPARTGHALPSTRPLETLPMEPKVIWRLKMAEGFASPVLARGILFTFDNQSGQETLHALRSENGQELWRTAVDETFQDEQGPPGPRCTPVVAGDPVYAQSGMGELACLRVKDGHSVWRTNFRKDFGAAFLGEDSRVPGAAEHGYTAAPVIAGDRLIACVGGTNAAGIVCFDKHTGKVLWKSQDDLAAYAAPQVAKVAGEEQAVCFTVEGLISLALENGRLLWRVPLKTSYGRNCATPVIVDDWIVAGSYRAGLIGVRVSRTSDGFKAEQVWLNKGAAVNFSSPVAVGRHVYGLGPTKNIFCVEIETGRLAWTKEGYFTTSPDVAHASFLVVGTTLLICTDGGELILLRANPSECQELGRAQVCGLNWCNPAYAEGRVYVRDGIKSTGHLTCVEVLPPLEPQIQN